MQTADEIRSLLGLTPHPEGGYYRETFRDPLVGGNGRAASTAIYFLLEADQVSRWHRVDATEVWHFYAGDPLELATVATEHEVPRKLMLGTDLLAGQRPQIIVPAGHWQQARSLGRWTLVGCTVAPAFTFEGFEMAPATFAPVAGTNRTASG
jgi:predicted cupin superfamily sugar epimerase